MQFVSVGLTLLGLGLAALWSMPPFWVPFLYAVAYCLVLGWHLFSKRPADTALWAAGPVNTVLVLVSISLGLAGGYLGVRAIQGRQLPPVDIVDIAPPFGPGTYIIANGGSDTIVNSHLHTLDPAVDRYRLWRGQSRALDIFRIKPSGLHMNGFWPSDPALYTTFGTPVLAPCSGAIELVVDGVADMQVPQMDRQHMAGNYVALNCGEFFVILAHLQKNSVRVRQGDTVEIGARLGEMGNSGNSSEPHLHVHAQRGLPEDSMLGGEPLALTIDGRFLVRNDRITVDAP
ncbi:M23 family metallopeptidase [Allohahella marinimesophila]|uniref:M23ase beta-sheet core domain-containing protein n=1 Tax=Allohahella marinimesophila TaxID=1054972 RepID=A0ABP7PG86_9GAMM